jgi:Response regulators consisting of a CheY-like receiver domain and a winged-helix DNA-binding domain
MDAVAENHGWVRVDDLAVHPAQDITAGTVERADAADPADPDAGTALGYEGTVENRFLNHPRVLIVDDDADTRAVIASMLERDGLVALQAEDGETALRMVAESDVDAVILDVVMPDHSGYEICQRLREDSRAMHLPVIMLTALSSLHAEVSGILSGADAYLVKPVRRKELMDRVREML